MNSIVNRRTLRAGLGVGLLLGAVALAEANSIVTFQVDMSTSGIDTNTQSVAARGSFNGWGALGLTNDHSAANPLLFTGTTNLPFNGTVMQYKYTIEPGANYEPVYLGGSHNRLITLPSTSGASITLPQVYYGDASPSPVTVWVTFQVDLAQQINTGAFNPASSAVQARGLFNGWGGSAVAQTNDPTILRTNQNGLVTSNVYVYPYEIVGSPGQTMDFKYYIDTGANWESPTPGTGDPNDNNNRFFNLAEGPTQTLPIVYFSDAPYAPVSTVDVTFQVDMTAQVMNGNFDPLAGTVEVRGNFNSWGTPQILLTNDPAALNTNIYKMVVRITDGIGAVKKYKFWSSVPVNGGWEQPNASVSPTDGAPDYNRVFNQPDATSHILPVVNFSDLNPNDLLPADALVTFTVNMTNAVGTDAHAFDRLVDAVYLNGVPSGFGTWDTSLPQLTNNPDGSGLYSIELLIPKGSPVQMTYKYGINGADNEAASGDNHIRFIRTAGTYALPMDKFGNQHAEPSFGQLAIGAPSGGNVPVSWLGRPGVHLQTKADLSSGTWMDLLNTDGAGWANGSMSVDGFVSVTNYPASGDKTFLRLIKQ